MQISSITTDDDRTVKNVLVFYILITFSLWFMISSIVQTVIKKKNGSGQYVYILCLLCRIRH